MKYSRINRRMFLQGAGSTALAIPFLGSLLPREAWADALPSPKRFISILSNYDHGHNSNWLPNLGTDPANLLQPNRIFNPGNGERPLHWQPLSEFVPSSSSSLSPIMGSSLNPYLESLNVLRSLDFVARAGHDCSQVLGGMFAGFNPDIGSLRLTPTIDHVLNGNKRFNPAGLPLVFCGSAGGAGSYWSNAPFRGGAAPATNMGSDLTAIYNRLFAGGTWPEANQAPTKHAKADLMSRVIEDYARVRNGRTISSGDKQTLDDAMDKLSDVQKGLTRIATASCHHKQVNPVGTVYDASGSVVIGKALADLISAAVMCDTARTFTIGADIIYGNYDGQEFDHQITSHRPFDVAGGKAQWQRMGARHAGVMQNVFAPLVQNLASAIDPSNGKSFLYNSLLIKSSESGQVHGWGSHPTLLAGNAGGTLNSGNYIDYSDRSRGAMYGADGGDGLFSATPGAASFSNNYYGVPYNRLLVTIMQSLGLTPADYENDADNTQLFGRADIGTQNANLQSLGGYGHAFRFDLTRGGYAANSGAPDLKNYDLKTFRYRLPLV